MGVYVLIRYNIMTLLYDQNMRLFSTLYTSHLPLELLELDVAS